MDAGARRFAPTVVGRGRNGRGHRRPSRRYVALGGPRQNFSPASRRSWLGRDRAERTERSGADSECGRCPRRAPTPQPEAGTSTAAIAQCRQARQDAARTDQQYLPVAAWPPRRQKSSISVVHRRRIWSAACPTARGTCAVPTRCLGARSATAVRRRRTARVAGDEHACRHGVAALTSARSRHPAPRAGDAEEAEPTLIERAARAARSELRGERVGILGALGESAAAGLTRTRPVPERWSLVQILSHFQ